MEDYRASYSSRLRAAMEERGVSIADLANATGAKPNAVGYWLSRGSVPFRPVLNKACAFLEISPEWLVNGIGPKHASRPRGRFDHFPPDLKDNLSTLGEAAMGSKNARRLIAELATLLRQ
jgi:transcriptional regulator with XRE-family HTH domain